jgi:hypothetical protein
MFRTKIDYSDNRQIKQRERTFTTLSGGTTVGVPFSALTSGIDFSSSGVTYTNPALIFSTFSGNSGTTIVTWGDSRMAFGEGGLSAITPSNSGVTQEIGAYAVVSSTVIDGNTVDLLYTGVTYDVEVLTMTDFGGSYTGTIETESFVIFSADSLDYKGRTIWLDNPEITRTKKLIVSENPNPGYVLTSDSEGMATWQSVSAVTSGATFWEEDGTGNTALKDDKGGHTINGVSNNSIIAGGNGNLINGALRSVILGGNAITATTDDTVNVPNLSVRDSLIVGGESTSNLVDVFGNNQRLYMDNSSTRPRLFLSGGSEQLTAIGSIEGGTINAGTVVGVRGTTEPSFPGYGKVGDSYWYSDNNANGANIINRAGTGTEDYIRLYAGIDATSTSHMHIQGSGATKGYVGINNENPTERLDVVGNGKFSGTLNIGTVNSGASVSNLAIDASGNVILGEDTDTLQTVDPYFDGGSLTAITWDVSGNSTNYEITITADTTLNLTNVRDGEYGTIWVEQGNNSGNTITFGTINGAGGTHIVANGGGGSPTLTTGTGNIDILTFTYNGNSNKMAWTVGNDYT